jgi:hypothetical protein
VEHKVWFVTCHTGEVGSDSHEIMVLPADYTQEQVDDICWEMALDNAAMYGIYPPSDGDSSWGEDEDEDDWGEDEDEDDWGDDRTSENIEGFAVPYDPEEHDGYSLVGDFTKEIEYQVKNLKESGACSRV